MTRFFNESLDNIVGKGEKSLGQMTRFFNESLENIVGKGENSSYQHHFLFQQYYQRISLAQLLNLDWMVKG